MDNFLKKVIGDKKRWNKAEARAKALPADYQVVYNEIKQYMWNLWMLPVRMSRHSATSSFTPPRASARSSIAIF